MEEKLATSSPEIPSGCEPVITVSSDNESFRTAIESVLRCKDFFPPRLHIVKEGFDLETDLREDERKAHIHLLAFPGPANGSEFANDLV